MIHLTRNEGKGLFEGRKRVGGELSETPVSMITPWDIRPAVGIFLPCEAVLWNKKIGTFVCVECRKNTRLRAKGFLL